VRAEAVAEPVEAGFTRSALRISCARSEGMSLHSFQLCVVAHRAPVSLRTRIPRLLRIADCRGFFFYLAGKPAEPWPVSLPKRSCRSRLYIVFWNADTAAASHRGLSRIFLLSSRKASRTVAGELAEAILS